MIIAAPLRLWLPCVAKRDVARDFSARFLLLYRMNPRNRGEIARFKGYNPPAGHPESPFEEQRLRYHPWAPSPLFATRGKYRSLPAGAKIYRVHHQKTGATKGALGNPGHEGALS